MPILPFLFFPLDWICGRIYKFAPTFLYAQVYHGIGLHIMMLALLLYIAWKIPYHEMKWKVFFSYLFIYEVFGAATYAYSQLSGDIQLRALSWGGNRTGAFNFLLPGAGIIEDLFIPACVVFIAWQIYKKLSRFDHSNSAQPNDFDIFIVFTYPKNFLGLLLSLFTWCKASSVAVYTGGYLYHFKKYSPLLKTAITTDKISSNKYFLINTGIKKSQAAYKLDKLVGSEWKICKSCINIFNNAIGPIRRYPNDKAKCC